MGVVKVRTREWTPALLGPIGVALQAIVGADFPDRVHAVLHQMTCKGAGVDAKVGWGSIHSSDRRGGKEGKGKRQPMPRKGNHCSFPCISLTCHGEISKNMHTYSSTQYYEKGETPGWVRT